jgi:ABC-type transport system involved in multi-copper enzyme maturation permease subunit
MSDLIRNGLFIWNTMLSPYWSILIPLALVLIGLIWLLAVYLRGKFRFLPALAIARVTVLDSIGRLEVVLLLGIGMLIVGVNGVIPNTMQGRSTLEDWMENPYFRERFEDLSSVPGFTPEGEEILVPEGERNLQLSAGQTEFGDLSVSGEEPSVTESGEGTEGPPSEETEGQPSRAEEIAQHTRTIALESLIWQAAFLMADFFVALIGFVLAMVVLPNEINRGVILSILPKPLSREEYVFGKAMGIWIIVSGCFLILTMELGLIQGIFDLFAGRNPWNWRLIMAMALFPFKYATLVLIIMGLTLRLPEVPAGIIGVAYFATGHFVDRIYEIAISPAINPILGHGLKFAYWILPHLSHATFGILDRDQTLITNWNELWGWVWQITIYNMILLWLLSWLFRRRSL